MAFSGFVYTPLWEIRGSSYKHRKGKGLTPETHLTPVGGLHLARCQRSGRSIAPASSGEAMGSIGTKRHGFSLRAVRAE
jgi:hypothetical protein